MKIYTVVMCDSGPVIAHNGLHAPVYRPDYTQAEAQQVVDWLNRKDQPLDSMKPREWDHHDPLTLWPQVYGRGKRG